KEEFLTTAKGLLASMQSALKEGNKKALKTVMSPSMYLEWEPYVFKKGDTRTASEFPQIRSAVLKNAWKDRHGNTAAEVEFDFQQGPSPIQQQARWWFIRFGQKWVIASASESWDPGPNELAARE